MMVPMSITVISYDYMTLKGENQLQGSQVTQGGLSIVISLSSSLHRTSPNAYTTQLASLAFCYDRPGQG